MIQTQSSRTNTISPQSAAVKRYKNFFRSFFSTNICNLSIPLFPWLVILSLFRCCARSRPGRNEGWPRCNWYHSTIQLVYFLTHPPHLFLAASSMSYNPLKGLPRLPTLPGHWPWSPPIRENIYFGRKKYLKPTKNFQDIVNWLQISHFSLFWIVWRLENKHFVSVRPRQVVRRSWWLNCLNCLFIWNIFGRIVSLKASLSPLH